MLKHKISHSPSEIEATNSPLAILKLKNAIQSVQNMEGLVYLD
jgi:hypothetical protein